MMSSFLRSPIIALGVALLAGCAEAPAESAPVARGAAPLLDGERSFPLLDRLTNTTTRIRLDEEDEAFQALMGNVGAHCDRLVDDARYSDLELAPGANEDVMNLAQAAHEQARRLCTGYTVLEWSQGLAPIDVRVGVDETSLTPRRTTSDPNPEGVQFTIPVLAGSDAASAAILAAHAFQQAALHGREIMRANVTSGEEVSSNFFLSTLPSANEERVTLGFVVVSQTNEALQMMDEAGEVATRLIAAAAQERLALDPDRQRARVESWRARHDSRLEIASLWGGVPEEVFQPEPTEIADGVPMPDGGIAPAGPDPLLYPVVTWAPTRASERRAVDLLRDTRVDPTTGGEMTVADRLRTKLQTDHPDQFPETVNTEDFLAAIGVEPSELALAAGMLVQEAAALGRPILRESGGVEPYVVRGTGQVTGRGEPTFVTAHTMGTVNVDDGDLTPDDLGFLSDGFCQRGFLQTRYCATADARAFDQGMELSGDTEALVSIIESETNAQTPELLQVTVGAEVGSAMGVPLVDEIRVRLYGVRGNDEPEYWDERLELWWGDEGRTCALSSTAEEPCPDALQITATPSVPTFTNERAVEWTIRVDDVPGEALLEGKIRTDTPIYVTRRRDPGQPRDGITGFVPTPTGPTGPRTTLYPAGPKVPEVVGEPLVPDAAHSTEPALACTGVYDGPLPLEDVFTEAGVSGDFMEAAFLHYIDRADAAAVRAEQLGERLIAEQLEMDSMAEGSIQRLNETCGTSLSVGRIEMTPPATCTDDSACGGAPCLHGRCATGLVDGGDDLARLRRCIGEDEAPEWATLGDIELCAWELGGIICDCPASTTCTDCMVPGPSCGTPPTGSNQIRTSPLGLITSTGPTLPVSDGACVAFARLRAGMGSDEDLDVLRTAGMLSVSTAQLASQSLTLRESFGGFIEVGRGGRPWLTTGTLFQDPTSAMSPPTACRIDPELPPGLCETDAPFGPSIRCQWGQCGTHSARRETGLRLSKALHTLNFLSGVGSSMVRSVTWVPRASGGSEWTADDIPSWVGLSGRVLSHYGTLSVGGNPLEGDVLGSCLEVASYGDSGLSSDGWPLCGAPPGEAPLAAFATMAIPTGAGSRRRDAVRMWHPTADDTGSDWVPYGRPLPTVGRLMRDAVADETPRRDFGSTFSAGPGDDGVIYSPHVFDALELMCASMEGDVGGCSADVDELPTISSAADLDRLKAQVECAASRFEGHAQRLLFQLPPLVLDDIAASRISGTYPAYAGAYGEQIAMLRGQMEGVVGAIQRVAATVRDIAGDLSIARSQEEVADLEGQVRERRLLAELSSHLSRCLASAAPSLTVGTGITTSFNTGSIFVCMDTIFQMAAARSISALQTDIMNAEARGRRTDTAMRYASRMDAISEATRALSEAFAGVNATLSRMVSLRNTARRDLAHALFLDRDDVAQEWVLGRGMRGRHNRTREQYEEAHANAVQLAWLARRAIEQRIGMNMSDMEGPTSLIDPPSTWADSLCATTGVDFYELWAGSEDHLPRGINTVADYVQRLRMFLDSYMLDFPFENSSDVTVLSLRDDFPSDVRMECPVRGHNILRSSEALDTRGGGEWWYPICDPDSGDACLGVSATTSSVFGPLTTDPYSVPTGATRGTRAVGGGREFRLSVTCPLDGTAAADCGGDILTGGMLGQTVALAPGEYIVSWYERVVGADDNATCVADPLAKFEFGPPLLDVQLGPLSGDAGAVTTTSIGYLPSRVGAEPIDRWLDDCRWARVARRFVVASHSSSVRDAPYELVLRIADLTASLDGASSTTSTHVVSIAGVSLDLVGPDSMGTPFPIVPEDVAVALDGYFPTDSTGTWPVGPCLDRDARDLQRSLTYRCDAALCPDGIGTACTSSAGFDPDLQTCYWEMDFDISLLDIERGATIPNGGFAVGNFNYRTDSLAVNLVGTGIRDCSRVGLGGEGCYGSGYVPFSLHHTGGWEVRNHAGDTFDEEQMQIFPGAIVSAKALAAERYITNPISSADRALFADHYWRGEFRGRPLNGRFVLRIHDVPGLDIAHLEDVQIVLGYRYWTRQR